MDKTLYKEHILDHYKNPRNRKDLKNFTHSSDRSNRSCGDEVTITLFVEDNTIKDLGYDVRGCAICTASISMLSEEVVGKNIEDVGKITDEEMLKMVGMTPKSGRSKCAILGLDALREALKV